VRHSGRGLPRILTVDILRNLPFMRPIRICALNVSRASLNASQMLPTDYEAR
jgi:hypothetical protein